MLFAGVYMNGCKWARRRTSALLKAHNLEYLVVQLVHLLSQFRLHAGVLFVRITQVLDAMARVDQMTADALQNNAAVPAAAGKLLNFARGLDNQVPDALQVVFAALSPDEPHDAEVEPVWFDGDFGGFGGDFFVLPHFCQYFQIEKQLI